MISKIKGMLDLREDIDALNRAMVVNKQLVEQLAEGYKKETDELTQIKSFQLDFMQNFKANMAEIKNLRDAMKNELEHMRQIKLESQKAMLQRFERELQMVFHKYMEELKIDKQKYEKTKQQVDATVHNLYLLQGEIGKLREISQRIKKEDFELTQFHTRILKEDQYKVKLLQKIDELETICARLKRGQR